MLTQMVRKATKRRCRCHGISGSCQFQSCWDQIPDLSSITNGLKSLYLGNASKVVATNLGTVDDLDIGLIRSNIHLHRDLSQYHSGTNHDDENLDISDMSLHNRSLLPNEFLYLYDSPNYCNRISSINHPGTKGRICKANNFTKINLINGISVPTGSKDGEELRNIQHRLESCEHLCCNRGYSSELIMMMVTCNCRFKFCCHVNCDQCLQQVEQHYCS